MEAADVKRPLKPRRRTHGRPAGLWVWNARSSKHHVKEEAALRFQRQRLRPKGLGKKEGRKKERKDRGCCVCLCFHCWAFFFLLLFGSSLFSSASSGALMMKLVLLDHGPAESTRPRWPDGYDDEKEEEDDDDGGGSGGRGRFAGAGQVERCSRKPQVKPQCSSRPTSSCPGRRAGRVD